MTTESSPFRNIDPSFEVNGRVEALLTHTTELARQAPEIANDSLVNHPISTDFHVVSREVTYGGRSIRFNPNATSGVADDTINLGGVSRSGEHEITMPDAQRRYNELIQEMLQGDDSNGRVRTAMQRLSNIGGVPCMVDVELVQRPSQGELYPITATFSAYRDLPDDTRFMQSAHVSRRSTLAGALRDRDAIVLPPHGFYGAERDEARAIALAALPESTILPVNRPLGFDECDWLLGIAK